MGGARAVSDFGRSTILSYTCFPEVARLGGARAVAEKSCEKIYKSRSRAIFIVFFAPGRKKKQKVRSAPAGGA